MDLSAEALQTVLASNATEPGEPWLPYENAVIDGPPEKALEIVVSMAKAAADDDALCRVGINLVEPLLDLHWRKIGYEFEAVARRTPALRRALSCASLDIRPKGQARERRFYDLVKPEDRIGRSA